MTSSWRSRTSLARQQPTFVARQIPLRSPSLVVSAISPCSFKVVLQVSMKISAGAFRPSLPESLRIQSRNRSSPNTFLVSAVSSSLICRRTLILPCPFSQEALLPREASLNASLSCRHAPTRSTPVTRPDWHSPAVRSRRAHNVCGQLADARDHRRDRSVTEIAPRSVENIEQMRALQTEVVNLQNRKPLFGFGHLCYRSPPADAPPPPTFKSNCLRGRSGVGIIETVGRKLLLLSQPHLCVPHGI